VLWSQTRARLLGRSRAAGRLGLHLEAQGRSGELGQIGWSRVEPKQIGPSCAQKSWAGAKAQDDSRIPGAHIGGVELTWPMRTKTEAEKTDAGMRSGTNGLNGRGSGDAEVGEQRIWRRRSR
jgi:hypothetical protein